MSDDYGNGAGYLDYGYNDTEMHWDNSDNADDSTSGEDDSTSGEDDSTSGEDNSSFDEDVGSDDEELSNADEDSSDRSTNEETNELECSSEGSNSCDDESENEYESDSSDELESFIIGKEYSRFGFFKCEPCDRKWCSASAYCRYQGLKNGENVFKPLKGSRQACALCENYYLPYKNQALRKLGGTVHTSAHLVHLCERCQAGRRCRHVI